MKHNQLLITSALLFGIAILAGLGCECQVDSDCPTPSDPCLVGHCGHVDQTCGTQHKCLFDNCNHKTGRCLGPCTTDADCDDGAACTTDRCSDGQCSFIENCPLGRSCNRASGECTIDCTSTGCGECGTCDTTTKTCIPLAGKCMTNADCPPMDKCHEQGMCGSLCGCGPGAPKNCDDNNKCTTDSCDLDNGNCVNEPIGELYSGVQCGENCCQGEMSECCGPQSPAPKCYFPAWQDCCTKKDGSTILCNLQAGEKCCGETCCKEGNCFFHELCCDDNEDGCEVKDPNTGKMVIGCCNLPTPHCIATLKGNFCGCASDSECAPNVCLNSECVQCRDDTQCSANPILKHCLVDVDETGTIAVCVECTDDSHCPAGKTCDDWARCV